MGLLNTKVLLQVAADLTKTLDLKSGSVPLAFARGLAFGEGTGANQVDMVWDDQRTIVASGTDDLDLAGVLVDAFGVTLTFARVKAIVVAASSANTNNVVIGNHPTAAFVGPFGAAAHTAQVRPGGLAAFVCTDVTGWPVTAATADILRLTNSGAGTSVSYDVVILGSSA